MKIWFFLLPVLLVTACVKKPDVPPAKPPVQEQSIAPVTKPEAPLTHKPETKATPAAPKTRTPHPKPLGKHIVTGFVEKVRVGPQSVRMNARIDTGAKTSSIDADVIKVFKRDEKRRVLFSINSDDGTKLIFESRLVRYVRIKSKTGKFIRRPVVYMDICLAGIHIQGEVNLAERGHMNYPMLVGRNMMAEKFVVNPAVRYITKPDCNTTKESES